MRVAFFGQSGPYAPEALRSLLYHRGPFSVVWVVQGRRFPVRRQPHHTLRPAPAPWPDTEALETLAQAAGLPVLQTCDVNAPWVADELRRRQIDVLVCVGFDRLFSPTLIDAVPHAFNAHPSALPRWRGPAPLFWALKDGVGATAVTVHGIDAREDHGIVYEREVLTITPRTKGDVLYNRAGRLAARLVARLLTRLATGQACGVPQDHSRATRAPRPRAEDVRVDPTLWECDHLVNFACAAPYFRAPWLRLGTEVFFVRRGLLAEPRRRLPAQYVLVQDRLVVQCADGVAHLQVQTDSP